MRDFVNEPSVSLKQVRTIIDHQNLANDPLTRFKQNRMRQQGLGSSASYNKVMQQLFTQSVQPQYETNRSAMYSRNERTIIASIGEERAAKLNYELTRHHARQQQAISMDEMVT